MRCASFQQLKGEDSSMSSILRRLQRLRAILRAKSLDAALITHVMNVRYLSGFTGDDSVLLIGPKCSQLITDFRYTEQAGAELRGTRIEIIQRKKSLLDTVALAARRLCAKSLAFESDDLSFQTHADLVARLRDAGVKDASFLKPAPRLVSALRERKDAGEIAAIRKALAIAQEAFRAVLPALRPGLSERDVAVELEYQMKRRGAMAASFPIIVAGGPRGSLPHARPTDRKLRAGEPIVIDWGALVDFYCSDLTRTVFLSTIPKLWKARYELVLKAQARGIAAVAAGAKGRLVDRAARAFLAKHRLGKRFGHGLGHGVGMAIHEAPSLGAQSAAKLQPGMVVTVEPGIYLPGQGGIRIEDMVLVRREGAEVLSSLEKGVDAAVL